MQANVKNSLRLTGGALAVATSLFAGGAQAAPSYMAVLPLAGLDANQALRPVDIALAGATPPAAMVGVPYEFNLGALLSLDGPEGTTRDRVSWSIVSGELPAGLELVGDRITGVPEGAFSPSSIIIQAEYLSGYQRVEATRGYVFETPAEITDFGAYRAWADGTFAQTCNGYHTPTDGIHQYKGATGDGVYRISPAGIPPFDVRCDMTTEGGGWTLVEYAADLPLANRWTSGDAWRWVPQEFTFKQTAAQVNAIRATSTTAKQTYVSSCDGVLMWQSATVLTYKSAVGFRYHTGEETGHGLQTYAPGKVSVTYDGCRTMGSGGRSNEHTDFQFEYIGLPIVNIMTSDSGDSNEFFGSPLTKHPARFR